MTTVVIDIVNRKVFADCRRTNSFSDGLTGEETTQHYDDTVNKLRKRNDLMFTGAGSVSDIEDFIDAYGVANIRPKETGSVVIAFDGEGKFTVYEAVNERFLIFFKMPVWKKRVDGFAPKYLCFGSGKEFAAPVMEVTHDGALALKAAARFDAGTSSRFNVESF